MLRKTLALLLTLLLCAQSLLPATVLASQEGGETMAKVTASSLNIRSGPGTANRVVVSAPSGTVVTILQVQGDWANVRLEDGTEGWAASRYLEAFAPEPAPDPEEGIPAGSEQTESALEKAEPPRGDGGGSALGAVFKWGCLLGALGAGALAYSEKTSGDDAYDEYKDLFQARLYAEADEKFGEAEDHDDKATVYAIAGGEVPSEGVEIG